MFRVGTVKSDTNKKYIIVSLFILTTNLFILMFILILQINENITMHSFEYQQISVLKKKLNIPPEVHPLFVERVNKDNIDTFFNNKILKDNNISLLLYDLFLYFDGRLIVYRENTNEILFDGSVDVFFKNNIT